MKVIIILLIFSLFFCGCSSTRQVHPMALSSAYSYIEMNKKLKGRTVKIELKNAWDITARDVTITVDSVFWINKRTKEQSKTCIGELNKIVVNNHFGGGLEGLGFGLAVCGGTALALGNSQSDNTGSVSGAIKVMACFFGPLTGLITGLIKGHRIYYEFQKSERSDSLQKNKQKEKMKWF